MSIINVKVSVAKEIEVSYSHGTTRRVLTKKNAVVSVTTALVTALARDSCFVVMYLTKGVQEHQNLRNSG